MKDWLKRNKIYFETITATLLAMMAVIVSVIQIIIGINQTELMKLQTEFNERQIAISEKNELMQWKSDWGELRNTIWEILEQFPPNGIDYLVKFTIEERIKWKRKIRKLLDSQINNPVLLENSYCLGHWRNAISTTLTMNLGEILVANDKQFIAEAKTVSRSVMITLEKIILDSDEVSATGGTPPEPDSTKK